jgi:anti-sigma-K factor RskA
MTLAGSETALLLIADSRQCSLHVRMVGHAIGTADLSMQLWAVSGQGRTRSLGVLDGYAELKVALPAAPHDADVAILAVSLEPKGGSRDPDRPTGPILYQGNWMNLMQD